MGVTVVMAKVTHIGEDYATVELKAQIVDTKNRENSYPTIELEVPLVIGKWLEEQGAYES